VSVHTNIRYFTAIRSFTLWDVHPVDERQTSFWTLDGSESRCLSGPLVSY
jgi:hypothetical protein